MLPRRRCASDSGSGAIREHDKTIPPEDLRDSVAIIGEVVIVGCLQATVRCLEFEEHKRNAVHEADEITATSVHLTEDPQLLDKKEVVRLGLGPIDELNCDDFVVALIAASFNSCSFC